MPRARRTSTPREERRRRDRDRGHDRPEGGQRVRVHDALVARPERKPDPEVQRRPHQPGHERAQREGGLAQPQRARDDGHHDAEPGDEPADHDRRGAAAREPRLEPRLALVVVPEAACDADEQRRVRRDARHEVQEPRAEDRRDGDDRGGRHEGRTAGVGEEPHRGDEEVAGQGQWHAGLLDEDDREQPGVLPASEEVGGALHGGLMPWNRSARNSLPARVVRTVRSRRQRQCVPAARIHCRSVPRTQRRTAGAWRERPGCALVQDGRRIAGVARARGAHVRAHEGPSPGARLAPGGARGNRLVPAAGRRDGGSGAQGTSSRTTATRRRSTRR